ncbi:MAG: hypothetical protein ACXVSL_06700 [Solirubrobacteraceae bacterium]
MATLLAAGLPGGGDTGAIPLSPFVRPGTVSRVPCDHFSVPPTVQGIFRDADRGPADPGVGTIGLDVFNLPGGR